jgi:sterol 3beta-glucosyltransferase
MRILVTSYGTEGDTRPSVALCQGLIHAGHNALLLGEVSGAELAGNLRVPFAALPGDIRGAIRTLLASGTPRGPAEVARKLAALGTQYSSEWMRAVAEHGQGCDAIVFSGLTSYVALSVAEHLGVPAIGAGVQPAVPTRDFASPFLPPLRLPAFCNRLSHRLVTALLWRAFRTSINSGRRAITGQRARRSMWHGYPILLGVSPQLVPRPRDWPDSVEITGDWPLPSVPWKPRDVLAQFFSKGDSPVYIGFGSMIGFDRKQMLKTLVTALRGRRALLSGGWSELGGSDLPANILPIGPVPHDELFPLVSVAIHHGGAGTSHTAARAGIPSVVIPFAGDQFFWARQLARAGVATAYEARAGTDAAALGRALIEAESDRMRERAREVGRRMRAESGVSNAVASVERLAGGDARRQKTGSIDAQ